MVSCMACGLSDKARKAGITFHRFPKKPELYAAWMKFVNKTEEMMPKVAVLCSQHFEEMEFDRSAFRVLLSRTAVPSKLVNRHKYERIVAHDPAHAVSAAFGSNTQNSSKQTDAVKPEPVEIFEAPHSPEQPKIIPQSTADTPRKTKLQQQLCQVANTNVRQAQQIRKLQKKKWFQKKRIFELTAAIKELRTKKFVNADQESTFIEEFGSTNKPFS
ncbi:hypothetical protein RI129_000789 [Pyrocoelia pectoralis]|uniref:THAP-type domain-containing protein n=1 Tax=Pyrocoelia pectoralis TaxID=417401 RepID=A0AAN7ZJJ6_9COLE